MRFSFYLAQEATTPGLLDLQLAQLLHKLYGLEKRVLVRCPDEDRAQRLSDVLWKNPTSGFLPHAIAADELPPQAQPLYLGSASGNLNSADVLLRLMGSEEDTSGFEDVIEFFGGLEAEKAAARLRWKVAKETGADCRFFIQQEGRWVLKK